jgi:hypothetical protein
MVRIDKIIKLERTVTDLQNNTVKKVELTQSQAECENLGRGTTCKLKMWKFKIRKSILSRKNLCL